MALAFAALLLADPRALAGTYNRQGTHHITLLSMKTYDWIVVGNGIAGAAVSYELAKVGFSVLLLEQSAQPQNATRYSYGGIAYWSGQTDLMRLLCQEGIAIHRSLSAELEADTQFRELDLLLTVDADRDPVEVANIYSACAISPVVLSPETAWELEPLLNRGAMSGVLRLPHGHVSPEAMVAAYNQAFLRLGGEMQVAQVTGLLQSNQRVQGVRTPSTAWEGEKVLLSTGGISRALLQLVGLSMRLYFTHAELIETPPMELKLQTLVMPAELKRFAMEAEAGKPEVDRLWEAPNQEVTPPILDAGVVQFLDGRLRLGQVSRTLTDPKAQVNAAESEAEIRHAVGRVLPALQSVPGQWHSCLVSFSGDRLPVMGAIPDWQGIQLFTGFSNPFAILPPLARRFAQSATGKDDPILATLSPARLT